MMKKSNAVKDCRIKSDNDKSLEVDNDKGFEFDNEKGLFIIITLQIFEQE